MSSILYTSAEDSNFVGKAGYLSLLGEVGNAVAIGSEAGEDVDEISTGYLDLKVRTFKLEYEVRKGHGNSARLNHSVDTLDAPLKLTLQPYT